MKRKEAIDWLVSNVSAWPKKYRGMVSAPIGWVWFNFGDGQMSLINKWDKPIHKSDWVHFINQPHCDAESVYN